MDAHGIHREGVMDLLAPGSDLLARYDGSGARDFTVIRSAAEGLQNGLALSSGDALFILHGSGFCQFVGQVANAEDAERLVNAWRAHEGVTGRYVMLYDAPRAIARVLERQTPQYFRVRERQVFRGRDGLRVVPYTVAGAQAQQLDASNSHLAERLGLNLSGRFWRSANDLFTHGIAVLVTLNDEPASLCYSAAVSKGVHEVDVLTAEAMRGKGLGRMATSGFMQLCDARGEVPNWDCFTANAPSMALAHACGLHRAFTYQLITFTA
jgi:hypothetical protein